MKKIFQNSKTRGVITIKLDTDITYTQQAREQYNNKDLKESYGG